MGLARTVRRCAELAATRAASAVYSKHDDIVVVKTLGETAVPARGQRLRVEPAERQHIPILADFNRRHCRSRRTKGLVTRMATGAGAFLGFLDDQLIGYIWWSQARGLADVEPRFARYGIELEDDEVYGFDLFVAPEYRGQGATIWFLASVEAELSRRGYGRMWGYVESTNLPARWLFSIHGYKVADRVESRALLSRSRRISRTLQPVRGGPAQDARRRPRCVGTRKNGDDRRAVE
jgi:GNAT superfamily N-acetyltransferase